MGPNINAEIFYLGDNPPIEISNWANLISFEVGNGRVRKLPFFIFLFSAKLGDFLKIFNINFPLNSYRLNNMKTNNIIDLSKTYNICGESKFSIEQGIKRTINWMINQSN
jgi:nucleoside-diphosphate-sugar epimerase